MICLLCFCVIFLALWIINEFVLEILRLLEKTGVFIKFEYSTVLNPLKLINIDTANDCKSKNLINKH